LKLQGKEKSRSLDRLFSSFGHLFEAAFELGQREGSHLVLARGERGYHDDFDTGFYVERGHAHLTADPGEFEKNLGVASACTTPRLHQASNTTLPSASN
jgi:hypothetical protein